MLFLKKGVGGFIIFESLTQGDMMRRSLIFASVLVALLTAPVSAYCGKRQEVVESVKKGSINWTKGILQAKGIGHPTEKNTGKDHKPPIATAREEAVRNLLEAVKNVRIDSRTLVRDRILESDTIRTEVLNLVKNAKPVEPVKYLSDRSVEMTIQMNLNGGFAQLILSREIKNIESIKPVIKLKKISPPPSKTSSGPGSKTNPAIYTGLVVDARGLGIKPAMVPKILDEDGREVYGPAFASREFVVQQGMGGYIKHVTAAQNCQRVANNPLTVKGLRTVGHERSDIVISNADASRIRSASEHLSFLKKCRVTIVVE